MGNGLENYLVYITMQKLYNHKKIGEQKADIGHNGYLQSHFLDLGQFWDSEPTDWRGSWIPSINDSAMPLQKHTSNSPFLLQRDLQPFSRHNGEKGTPRPFESYWIHSLGWYWCHGTWNAIIVPRLEWRFIKDRRLSRVLAPFYLTVSIESTWTYQ